MKKEIEMEQKIQNIIFPTSNDMEMNAKLFYRCEAGYLDRSAQIYYMADRTKADFVTYLNGCSYGKWKEYTDICGAKLELEISGQCKVLLVGYALNVYSPERTVFEEIEVNTNTKEIITCEYPDSDNLMIGFEIMSIENTAVYGGRYYGIYAEDKVKRDVTLSLATTTCKKEEFITSNVALIKKEILESKEDADMAENFYVNVVDNGRTLNPADMEDWHIKVHPNKNTGGSGGFARGMIESITQTPKATNVLLMDDDVVVLPESIKRTYRLLTLVNDAYKDALISGAMLYLEEMSIQHEDIGTITKECFFRSLKGRLNQNEIACNLRNESEEYGSPYHYAGWWYCCIPTEVIKEKGLPMPFFIRIDDAEYGIRSQRQIMTMNGIGIWHMGFFNKYNMAFDGYQQARNLLIGQAIGSFPDDIDVFGYVYKYFRKQLLTFNYNGARLIMRALEDYLKGPDFIEQDLGEKIVQENFKLNEKYVSLKEFKNVQFNLPELYYDPPRKPMDTLWYRVTYNGHRFWSTSWLKDDDRCVMFDFTYHPQKYVRARKLIAVNPDMKVAAVREIDKKQYKEIKREWDKAVRRYKKENGRIRQEYLDKKPYLTSMEFWKKYLEL